MEPMNNAIIRWCEEKLMQPDIDPEFRRALVDYLKRVKREEEDYPQV